VGRDAALLWVGRAWSLGAIWDTMSHRGVLVLVKIDVSQLPLWRYYVGLERRDKFPAGVPVGGCSAERQFRV
jgi:hypothetical protein